MPDRTKAPATTGFPTPSLPKVETTVTTNGITLTSLHSGEIPIVQLILVWAGGSLDFDNQATPILAANALREGTSSHSCDEIETAIDFAGAWLKCEAGDHFTKLTINSLTSQLNGLLPLLAEVITGPTYPIERLSRHRDQLSSDIELKLKKPSYQADLAAFGQFAGATHPLSKAMTAASANEVTTDMLKAAHAQIYTNETLTAYMAGDITGATMKAVIRFLESLTATGQAVKHNFIPFDASLSSREAVVDMPGSLQSAITMSLPTIPRIHEDYCMTRLATMALGGYFGSRLMTNIREKRGLTYGITAGVYGYIEGATIMVSCQCDNRNVGQVIEQTQAEMRRLAAEPPCGDELARLRQTASTGIAAILDSPFSVLNYLTGHRTNGTPADYFDRQQRAVSQLSADTIADAARRYLDPAGLMVAIAGDSRSIVK